MSHLPQIGARLEAVPHPDYYDADSSDLAHVTPLTVARDRGYRLGSRPMV